MDHTKAISTVYEVVPDFDVTSMLIQDRRSPNSDQGRFTLEARPGQSLGGAWVAQDFRHLRPDEEGYYKPKVVADFFDTNYTSLGHIGFRQRVLNLLGDTFGRDGELLPATYVHNDGIREQVWIFRPLRQIDAIDYEHTIGGRRYGRVFSGAERLALVQERLVEGIFHLSGLSVYCTDSFKNEVEAAGLTGLYFKPVWSTKPEVRERIMAWEKRVGYKLPPM
jgi:hypothetical protein